MSTSSVAAKRNLSGKIYDPVFLCMVIAMMLAVGSSVALRAVMAGAGPAGVVRGDEDGQQAEGIPARRMEYKSDVLFVGEGQQNAVKTPAVRQVEKDAGK